MEQSRQIFTPDLRPARIESRYVSIRTRHGVRPGGDALVRRHQRRRRGICIRGHATDRPLKYAEIRDLPPRTSVGHQLRPVHMWLLDFNQCGAISLDDVGVDSVVKAFWENDPYYPRPVPSTNHQDYGL